MVSSDRFGPDSYGGKGSREAAREYVKKSGRWQEFVKWRERCMGLGADAQSCWLVGIRCIDANLAFSPPESVVGDAKDEVKVRQQQRAEQRRKEKEQQKAVKKARMEAWAAEKVAGEMNMPRPREKSATIPSIDKPVSYVEWAEEDEPGQPGVPPSAPYPGKFDLSALAGKGSVDAKKVVSWVAENLDVPGVTPEMAPSASAWSMLDWARTSPRERGQFYATFFKKLVDESGETEQTERRRFDDDDRELRVLEERAGVGE